jgi:hypothetical protein
MKTGGHMHFITQFIKDRIFIFLAIFAVIVFSIGYMLSTARTQAATQQPFPFNHKIMVSQGIDCLYCHSDALRSPSAGMPSIQRCMGCHSVIATDSAAIKELTGYWDRKEPIQWVRVNQLPRFVYFSHEMHLHAGLNCENCHGDVGNMTVASPVVNMDMGWCLDCHKQQPNADQLTDCMVCHQ